MVSVDDAAWLANAVRQIEQGKSPLQALELARRPGQRSIATVAALDQCDVWLCEAAAKFFPGLSRPQQAQKICDGLIRYRNSAWQRGECSEVECPRKHRDRIEKYYWHILKARDRPLAAATICRKLGRELGAFKGGQSGG